MFRDKSRNNRDKIITAQLREAKKRMVRRMLLDQTYGWTRGKTQGERHFTAIYFKRERSKSGALQNTQKKEDL